MSSAQTPKSTGSVDGRVTPADEGLARAHELVRGADEQLARLSEQVAKMERDAARESSGARQPSSGSGGQSAPARPALRVRIGLPLAACIIVGVLILQWSQGWGAKLAVALWSPQLASAPSVPKEDPGLPTQSAPSNVQAAAAEAAPPQAAPVAQAAPQDAVPTATAAVPDHTEVLQAMARDLANAERSIEQLKATQQQIASESAKQIAELKASQEEIKRALAKLSEQTTSRTSPPPAQPTPTLRKPERKVAPPRTRARPRIPREEWIYDDW